MSVPVGESAPYGCEEPREERRRADEDAGPERRALGLLDAQLAHEEGEEGQDEGEAREDGEDHRDRDELVAAGGGGGHESSQTSPIACFPRISRRTRVRPLEPRSLATSAARPSRRIAASGPVETTTSRQRTPRLQPVPRALLAASLPATARARPRARSGQGGQGAGLLRVHQLADEALSVPLERA